MKGEVKQLKERMSKVEGVNGGEGVRTSPRGQQGIPKNYQPRWHSLSSLNDAGQCICDEVRACYTFRSFTPHHLSTHSPLHPHPFFTLHSFHFHHTHPCTSVESTSAPFDSTKNRIWLQIDSDNGKETS